MLSVHSHSVPDSTSGENKYFSLDLQTGAKILGLRSQDVKYEKLKFWVLADSANSPDKSRKFLLVIGCNVINEKPEDLIYIGTSRIKIGRSEGTPPCHLFEIK